VFFKSKMGSMHVLYHNSTLISATCSSYLIHLHCAFCPSFHRLDPSRHDRSPELDPSCTAVAGPTRKGTAQLDRSKTTTLLDLLYLLLCIR
jgi:hypothetical protein